MINTLPAPLEKLLPVLWLSRNWSQAAPVSPAICRSVIRASATRRSSMESSIARCCEGYPANEFALILASSLSAARRSAWRWRSR